MIPYLLMKLNLIFLSFNFSFLVSQTLSIDNKDKDISQPITSNEEYKKEEFLMMLIIVLFSMFFTSIIRPKSSSDSKIYYFK